MKKVLICLLLVMLLIPFKTVYAEEYSTSYATADGEEVVDTFKTYMEAELYRRTLPISDGKVSVVRRNSDGKVLSASHGIVKMNNTNINEFNIKQWYEDYYYSASISTYYATDALYLNTATGAWAQIQISGITGYVDIEKIDIIPMSHVGNANQVVVKADTNITIRANASTTSESLGAISKGQVYNFTKKVKDSGYTWYYINYSSNKYGWVASKGPDWLLEKVALNTYFYVDNNGDLVHKYESNANGIYNLAIGKAPNYLSKGKTYYSFDSHYFYTNLYRIGEDASRGYANRTNAINTDKPYFAYFMYLPSHSVSGYSAANFDNIVKSRGYNSQNQSRMYGMGYAYIEAQEKYGVNALMSFSKSSSESGFGTSAIAKDKNNLYGMGAYDSCAYSCAISYKTPYDSIMAYAESISKGSGYNNPNDWRYAGSHYGNKVSGMNKRYATDPYWGEIQSADSYRFDKNFGGMDYNSNTLGIKLSTDIVKVYKKPSTSSDVIYETKNSVYPYMTLPYLSFIVTDKVTVNENGKDISFYKVYTDPALDNNQNISTSDFYTFTKSYGYIKESDLYVENNQPVINASNLKTTQDEKIDLLNGVNATDTENGDLTSYITYTTNANYEKAGTYKVTYTVSDKQNFSTSKTVDLVIEEAAAPIITFTELEVSQYTTPNYLEGVLIQDKDTDILSKVTYTTLDTSILGTQTITYSATNSRGKTTTKERTVIIVKNAAPVLTGSNKTISMGDNIDLLSLVSATDKEDGKITNITFDQGNFDSNIPGIYVIKYQATDSVNNTATLELTVTVEEIKYNTNHTSNFYLNKMKFNETTQKLEFNGFAIMKNINNKVTSNIKYDLIFENQTTNEVVIMPLERWTKDVPFQAPNDKGFDYSGSWFKSELDLSKVPQGDYSLYVRVRIDKEEVKAIVANPYFNNNISAKVTAKDGRGYLFKTDYTNRAMSIQLFARDNGLIANINNPTIDNMYNQYYSLKFNENYLEIMGTSHNVKGNYASNINVERTIYLENIDTLELIEYKNIGAITNGPYKVSLKVSDNFDKTKAWYNAKLDLSTIKKGRYAIYIRTKAGSIDDYGELYDLMFSNINMKGTIGDKSAKIVRNDKIRYRLELIIE